MIGRFGSDCLSNWIAAAPTAELPPRTRIDDGTLSSDDKVRMNGKGTLRASMIALIAVQ
jgi:hypothetical protein